MVLLEFGEQILDLFKTLDKTNSVDENALTQSLKDFVKILLKNDVNVKIVGSLRDSIRQKFYDHQKKYLNKSKLLQKVIVDELVNLLKTETPPFQPTKGKTNIVMFVGLQGSGKTTTCTKYAYHYKKKGWRVALICADTFRAGAFDQLKQNATKVGLPFYGSYVEADPVKISLDGLQRLKSEKFDLIVIDTSGRHKQEVALFEEMRQMEINLKPDNVIFVIDSHIGQACFDQAKAFKDSVSVGSVIVTKLDGHCKGGGALSAVAATEAPVIFLGTGEHFDDFEPFEAHSFISRLLGMGDLKSLISTVTEVIPSNKQNELVQKLSQGVFTLRDIRDQFQGEKESIYQIKRFLIILDSLTDKELDCVKPLTNVRIVKIARGSGHTPKDVQALLERHKMFAKIFGKVGKTMGKKNFDPQNLNNKNANQLLQSLQKGMNPSLAKSFPGAQDLFNMMKQFQ